jgi:hypothetical protein
MNSLHACRHSVLGLGTVLRLCSAPPPPALCTRLQYPTTHRFLRVSMAGMPRPCAVMRSSCGYSVCWCLCGFVVSQRHLPPGIATVHTLFASPRVDAVVFWRIRCEDFSSASPGRTARPRSPRSHAQASSASDHGASTCEDFLRRLVRCEFQRGIDLAIFGFQLS